VIGIDALRKAFGAGGGGMSEIRTAIKKDLKNYDLKNIRLDTCTVIQKLETDFSHIEKKLFERLISQEIQFIRKQVEKSKNAHMVNNENKTINTVYRNNDRNNIYNYSKFLEEGKRLAYIKKAERNAEKAEKNAKQKAIDDEIKAKEVQRNAEDAQIKAKKDQIRQKKIESNKEDQNFMDELRIKSKKLNNHIKILKGNEKNISMVKDFIKILYKKDKEFMSKFVMWYSEKVLQIYRFISDGFDNSSINDEQFKFQLTEKLTAAILYESESFPKNNSLNYTYEESQAFTRFFIDTLNTYMKTNCNYYYNFIKSARYSKVKLHEKFSYSLKLFMMNILSNKLKIKLNNNNNGNDNNNGNYNNNSNE
jgi:hypothetical protein